MSTPLCIANRTRRPSSITRVVVAAGPRMVCDAFNARFEAEDGLYSMTAPGDINAVMATATTMAPDVLVVDTSIFSDSEEELVQLLSSLPTRPAIVALIATGDVESAARLLEAGAMATVIKNAPSSELVAAAQWAASGTNWVSPPLLRGVLGLGQNTPRANRDQRLTQLTERELEILQLVVDGLSRREIASQLFLSIETVRTHMCRIMSKLDVHSTIAAAALGRAAGLRPAREQSIAS